MINPRPARFGLEGLCGGHAHACANINGAMQAAVRSLTEASGLGRYM